MNGKLCGEKTYELQLRLARTECPRSGRAGPEMIRPPSPSHFVWEG